MKKIIIIFSVLMSLSACADVFDSPVKLEDIYKKMPAMGSIKCSFRQEKRIANISKPLVSGGDFEFLEGKGVYFYTKYPVQSTVDYTNEKYKQINDIVKAISAGKYSKLEKEFNFYFSKNEHGWSLGMKPKKNSDAFNYISSISLYGSDYINKININQTNGNTVSIWFAK